MEHLAFFNLANDPFRNDPALDHFFCGPPQRDALRRLLRLAHQGKELSLLTGATGVGKTTLLRSFFEDLDPDAFDPALLVVSRGVEPEWLRRSLATQLGIENPSVDRSEGMRELYGRLSETHAAEHRCLVLIDEAQALDASGLAELRSWMNLECEEQKLMSFVLAGDTSLEATLRAHPGFLGRVDARVEIEGFSQEGSREYLEHRLKRAGGHAGVFEDDAYAALAELSGGVARRLNALADNALFEAYLAGRTPATIGDVLSAARALPWAQKASHPENEIDVGGDLVDPNADSLDNLAASFGPVGVAELDSMGMGATNPDLGVSRSDSGSLSGLDDSIGGAFAMMTDDAGAAVEDAMSNPGDSIDIPEDFGSELLAADLEQEGNLQPDLEPEPEPESEPDTPQAPTPELAMIPEEDEIEGLFDNLVQDD